MIGKSSSEQIFRVIEFVNIKNIKFFKSECKYAVSFAQSILYCFENIKGYAGKTRTGKASSTKI